MRRAATRELILLPVISALILSFGIGLFVYKSSLISISQLDRKDQVSAQTSSCSSATISSITSVSFITSKTSYASSVKCLTEGSQMYLDDARFTFFKTPPELKSKQVALVSTDNVGLQSDATLSWKMNVSGAGDVYIFYRKIPGHVAPTWLTSYTKITSDSFADLNQFLLRKNDQGLIGVYDIYKKSVSSAQTVPFGSAHSNTGEAFSMYIVGFAPLISSSASPLPSVSIPPAKSGIWISQQEIQNLPTTGAAWTAVLSAANSSIGTANLADQNSSHPENTVAVALAAVRLNDEALKAKAVSALMSAIGTENNPDPDCASPKFGARGLAMGRNIIGYAVSADILNFRKGGYDPNGNGTRFEQWMDSVRHRKNCDSNGAAAYSSSIMDTPGTTSNGNSLTLASRVAAAGYLGDKADLDLAWLAFRRYAGDSSVGPNYVPNSYSGNWKSTNSPNYVGINPAGAHCSGNSSAYPADGVLPNDMGRGGNCPTDPSRAPTYGTGYQYPWEGMQGAYAQAVIYSRLGYKDDKGKDPWHMSDNALLRAVQYQCKLRNMPPYDSSWYDPTRAAWVKHLAYYAYGYRCKIESSGQEIVPAASGGGRNMDWAQWTFSRP